MIDLPQPSPLSATAVPGSGYWPQPAEGAGAPPDGRADHEAEKSAKIMLVDSEELSTEMLRAFLEQIGYRNLVSTSRPSEVFDLLNDERPDVLLLDLVLPEASGLEILARMRSDNFLKCIPVIMLTATADAATRLKALELGATDFLAKPVDASELAARLRNTLAVKTYQDKLAYSDVLTGLPNRERFLERLDWTIRFSRRYGTLGAVLHIGLNRFKHVNEALGPGIGDRLLWAVSQRLGDSLRETDIVMRAPDAAQQPLLSRMGGDEFTVLLSQIEKSADAAGVAQKVLASIAAPFDINGHELFATCCIGIALFPSDGTARDTVLNAAGLAMRHAKRECRDSYRFFSKDLNASSHHRLSLETELHKAIERSELELHYQPKVELKTHRLVGAEALVRWRHPQHGMVNPADFIPLAEETGLILPLGQWVLDTACRQIATWQAAGRQVPRISVNVSSHQFRQRTVPHDVQSALSGAQVDARYLCLEITESGIMENARDFILTLDELKASGVALSIDDFGTGYSSLSYLKRFPIDELKIDRSFVSGVERDSNSAAIVTAIIAMAHSLGFEVVAEGVESERELDFLRGLGCEVCQGYLYSRPLPVAGFGALLNTEGLPAMMPAQSAAV